ncbi:MAG: DUF2586 family protein [Bacteroidales bacterium]
MALNDIKFKKQNGGMARKSANEDPVSGLLLGLNNTISAESTALAAFDQIDVGGNKIYIAAIKYKEQAEAFGITTTTSDPSNEQKAINFIAYHVSEFFTASPSGTLYLAIKLSGDILPKEIAALQNYTGGAIRQMGIAAGGATSITAAQLGEYQTAAGDLEQNHMPLSIIVALCKGAMADLASLTGLNLSQAGLQNVSVVVAQDLDASLLNEQSVGKLNEIAAIGTLLGCVSCAAVNESVAWVQKFPITATLPGLITGEELKETSIATLNLLNDNRYIFWRRHVGASFVYWNDSHTLDVATSDYAYIENVRTMDKATRGIRANLLPYLAAPLKVDAESGNLGRDTVAVLETVAGAALEDMEKLGELSGYSVSIDPEQDILSTSTVEVVIKNVPMGVMRTVSIKIGFATKL